MESRISKKAFRIFSKEATYTPTEAGAESIAIRVIVTRSVQRINHMTGAVTRSDEADFDLSELRPDRGATLTLGTESWVIGDRISDDGYIITMGLHDA